MNPGVKIPKWCPRSLRGVSAGFANMHLAQVGLFMNLVAGSISLQYHVVFDYIFSTVVIITSIVT